MQHLPQPGKSWSTCAHHLRHSSRSVLCIYNSIELAQLILAATATTGGGALFSSRCTFKHREREILAFLVNFGYFVAKVCTLRCTFTGLNDAVVYQYGQIWGMWIRCFTQQIGCIAVKFQEMFLTTYFTGPHVLFTAECKDLLSGVQLCFLLFPLIMEYIWCIKVYLTYMVKWHKEDPGELDIRVS